ncbi:MAG: hypothetical protein QOI55_2743 [Actinomycetota bacterium]|nr:hypothetical protein [Actinomycetota bacterium]
MASNPIDRFLDAVETGTIPTCDAWEPDAVVDATVPNWRFDIRGVDAIRAEYTRWFGHPARFEQLRREPLAAGELVEYFLTWEEDGVPYAAHHVHILEVADGRIVADTVMCGGRWPASLLAEMEAAANA